MREFMRYMMVVALVACLGILALGIAAGCTPAQIAHSQQQISNAETQLATLEQQLAAATPGSDEHKELLASITRIKLGLETLNKNLEGAEDEYGVAQAVAQTLCLFIAPPWGPMVAAALGLTIGLVKDQRSKRKLAVSDRANAIMVTSIKDANATVAAGMVKKRSKPDAAVYAAIKSKVKALDANIRHTEG